MKTPPPKRRCRQYKLLHDRSWGDNVSNLIKVSDGLANGAIFEEIFVLDRTGDHSVGAETIDKAGDTLGVVKDG